MEKTTNRITMDGKPIEACILARPTFRQLHQASWLGRKLSLR
jgi:hypothetical protein